jgi:hypothetical protein
MVGERVFLIDAEDRAVAKLKLSRTTALFRQESDGCDPASELRE